MSPTLLPLDIKYQIPPSPRAASVVYKGTRQQQTYMCAFFIFQHSCVLFPPFFILIYLCAFSILVSLGQWFKLWVQGPVPVKIVVQNWPTSVFMILLQTGMSEKKQFIV